MAASKNEARRLIDQGGVKLDDEVQAAASETKLTTGAVLQVGKRRYLRLRLP